MLFRRPRPRLTPVTRGDAVRRILELASVKVGSGERALVVFFDLRCPFCAKLFRETEEVLLEMAQRGLIIYAMCDYVVHREAEHLHRALRCISEGERLGFIREVFSGKRVETGSCPEGNLRECEKVAEEVGVYGTPTLLFYHLGKDRGYVHFGYMSPSEVMETLSSL
ncbi:DsbA family protein [Pyrobaculum neutrophilum]|uniref:DsbA family protein n=1 Tax=Pyrobaculum neutrophilum TaxID=70771 RepID=UPI0011E52063|nr:thioredoxin fold domain-containing protein [Pyrobaculum neutrophilum]